MRRVRPGQLPFVVVLLVLTLGLVLGAAVDWKPGALVLGAALLLGAGLRLALPTRQVGLLAVRSRGADAAVLALLGVTTVVLANTIPEA